MAKRVRITTVERILELKRSNRAFWLHLSDGKELEVRGGDWVSVHPSGKGSHVMVYGPEEEEECRIPVDSIVRVWARETEGGERGRQSRSERFERFARGRRLFRGKR